MSGIIVLLSGSIFKFLANTILIMFTVLSFLPTPPLLARMTLGCKSLPVTDPFNYYLIIPLSLYVSASSFPAIKPVKVYWLWIWNLRVCLDKVCFFLGSNPVSFTVWGVIFYYIKELDGTLEERQDA